MTPYLAPWTFRLIRGVSDFDRSRRDRHTRFFLDCQNEDGGWAGRQGGSDLYYTGFALRSLRLFGAINQSCSEPAKRFLKARAKKAEESIVNLFSWMTSFQSIVPEQSAKDENFSEIADRVRKSLDRLRLDSGCYRLSLDSSHSSTYATFLALLLREAIGAPELKSTEIDRLVESLFSYQRADGGFVEQAPVRQSGTNPTAAAVGILKIVDRLDTKTAESIGQFLIENQTPEGGSRANSRIPVADLLSSFSSLVALHDLGLLDQIDRHKVLAFVDSLETAEGGYRSAAWDNHPDIEFTFYGIASIAWLRV
jgi:geranylgeranyl transferase type-2 subunit beta